MTPNVRNERAPEREALRRPNGDAVRRSARLLGWAAPSDHRMTSSARARIDSGMLMRKVFAVFMLTTIR